MENENRRNMEVITDEKEEIIYATPEEQMEEATARLETLVADLGLSPRVLNGWKKRKQIYYSLYTMHNDVSLGRIFKCRNMYEPVQAFEKKSGALVYYAMERGFIMHYLYVSKEKNYWEEERLEEGRYILLYGFDYRYPEWGERGSQELESRDGIVYSIDPCLRAYGLQ